MNTIVIEKQYSGKWYVACCRNTKMIHQTFLKAKPNKTYLRRLQLKFFGAEEVQVEERT